MLKGFFVAGANTDIGKTVASAALCVKLGARYWKPVQAGTPTDSQQIRQWLGNETTFPETYILSEPISPHLAAKIDGVLPTLKDFKLPTSSNPIIVEGAGGIMSPISDTLLNIDLMAHLALPTIIVVDCVLGAITQTLMTADCLQRRDIAITGVVLIGKDRVGNQQSLEHFLEAPIIGQIPRFKEINRQNLEIAAANLSLELPGNAKPELAHATP